LQNIPVRTAEGRRIRQAFICDKGFTMLSADYSQIELRIMAHLSGDAGLQQAFAQGTDVHRTTAAEVFNVELDSVTDEQRRNANRSYDRAGVRQSLLHALPGRQRLYGSNAGASA
jgi:DNA polymerase-1